MRDKEIIIKNYNTQCSLGHEHNIGVSYDTENNTFTISKEMPATEEDIAEEEKDIARILKEKKCEFHDGKVKRDELAGFSHEGYNSWDSDKKPICQNCWKENKEKIEHKDEYYTSLEDYLIDKEIKGDEELKNCSVLKGYPKKETTTPFNDFDKQFIEKFRQEVDVEGFQQRKKTYGQISDDQKLFVLEHLCWLRDQELRGSKEYEQFQAIIERIRDIYRGQNK